MADVITKFEETFRQMSSVFTGFSPADIQGTGLTNQFFETIHNNLGNDSFVELMILFRRLEQQSNNNEELTKKLRHEIFASPKHGPLARNIIQLWYTGNWNSLSQSWVSTYGPINNNQTYVVSAEGYLNGLVWPAIGAHPMGGKQEGFATWSFTPPTPTDAPY